MDWNSRDSSLFENDLKARPLGLCKYVAGSNAVASFLRIGDDIKYKVLKPKDDAGIKVWLREATTSRTNKAARGVYIIFAERAKEPPQQRNLQLLLEFPFLRSTFDDIVSAFLVNISIVRTLNKNQNATFSRTRFKHKSCNDPLISYNIRTSTTLVGDMAMSLTFHPPSGQTYAIIYGSNKETAKEFTTRPHPAYCGSAFEHPLLLAGIFAEIQRIKHREVIDDAVIKLNEYMLNMDFAFGKPEDDEKGPKTAMGRWMDVANYKTMLETWKVQLGKMVKAVDELSSTVFEGDVYPGDKEQMKKEGNRIKERLEDIIADYDELQGTCSWVLDGTTLANGMAWNHLTREDNKVQLQIMQANQKSNKTQLQILEASQQTSQKQYEIAESGKEDSTQMRSIALLTMLFLPGTFIAILFTIPLFNWNPDPAKGETVYNHRFWIYWVAAVCLTVGVLGLWAVFTFKKKLKSLWTTMKDLRNTMRGVWTMVKGSWNGLKVYDGNKNPRLKKKGRFWERGKGSMGRGKEDPGMMEAQGSGDNSDNGRQEELI